MSKTTVSNARSIARKSDPPSSEPSIAGMVELSRTVRFAIDIAGGKADPFQAEGQPSSGPNSFAGAPNMRGIGLHVELVVTVIGRPNDRTGYLINISEIDDAVRRLVVPLIEREVQFRRFNSPESVLESSLQVLQSSMAESGAAVREVRWNLTPYYSLTMSVSSPQTVLMAQSFEFAASHRLHCDDLDEASNRRIFGKCNNPSGHGHNYRVEVAVRKPLDVSGGGFTLQTLERIVHDTIIQRFDHKHLNIDAAEFASLNPSVENITRVCHDLLEQPIQAAGARLQHVTTWETEKTSCTYPAAGSNAQ